MNSEDRRFVVFLILLWHFYIRWAFSFDRTTFRWLYRFVRFYFNFILFHFAFHSIDLSLFYFSVLLFVVIVDLYSFDCSIENCVTNTTNCNANGSIWCVLRIYCLISSPFLLQTIRYPCIWCSKKIISLVAGYRCLLVINSKMLKLKPTTQSNITNDEFVTENIKFSFSCGEGELLTDEITKKENRKKK